jgi:hypothetical protein
MSYYVGKNLEMRVRAYGLEILQQHLLDVVANKAAWVDGVAVTPRKLEEIEQLRITLYSLLHDVGLKASVQVKMASGQLTMWRKKEPEKAGVHIPTFQCDNASTGITQEEDMAGLFSDTDPLLEPDVKLCE